MSGKDWRFGRRQTQHIFSTLVLLATLFASAHSDAALPPLTAAEQDEPPISEFDLTADRWQRFLLASHGRYQALVEKAEMLRTISFDDCADARLSLTERHECLRTDVFVRAAMERGGMMLDEYATVLHLTVVAAEPTPVSAHQRGQFQRLRAEWWPQRWSVNP